MDTNTMYAWTDRETLTNSQYQFCMGAWGDLGLQVTLSEMRANLNNNAKWLSEQIKSMKKEGDNADTINA
jgi:hypothetical protein